MPVALPIGQITVDPDTAINEANISVAAQILADSGVEDANSLVRRFLNNVPQLLRWLTEHGREYPWRSTTDP